MKVLSAVRHLLLVGAVAWTATSSFAWWTNRNQWGVDAGNGGYSSYNCYRSGNDLVSDWSGVWHKPNTYVMLYPSAVEGWQFNSDWYLWVTLNNSSSWVGCYFSPANWNAWDGDDVWDMALDIWCFDSKGGYQKDEVMLWNSWKDMQPVGSYAGTRGGDEYWEGWSGWTVHTMRSWGVSGSIDVKQLCIAAGVPTSRSVAGVQAGEEVCTGSASARLYGYSTWWQSN